MNELLKTNSSAAILAIALVTSAFVFGHYVKHIGTSSGTITVKGLAEKSIQADTAQWTLTTTVHGTSYKEALAALEPNKKMIEDFLLANKIPKTEWVMTDPSVVTATKTLAYYNGHLLISGAGDNNEVNAEEGGEASSDQSKGYYKVEVSNGFNATVEYSIATKDLARLTAVYRAARKFKEDDQPVKYAEPTYLVSNLESVKMSLIADATKNAQARAEEFVKNGNGSLGALHSASQGAFYILAPGAESNDQDYGGTYDKSTINKNARVVVSIQYELEH